VPCSCLWTTLLPWHHHPAAATALQVYFFFPLPVPPQDNLHETPVYGGWVDAKGPRYCPSIEDKIVRFADKDSHQVGGRRAAALTKKPLDFPSFYFPLPCHPPHPPPKTPYILTSPLPPVPITHTTINPSSARAPPAPPADLPGA
jgi:hypothetical protein